MASGKQQRGFASMDRQKQRDIARQGGRSVPDEKRSFSQNPGLAAAAGRTGGQNVPGEKRSFSQDRALAAQAGRKGGESRRVAHRSPHNDNLGNPADRTRTDNSSGSERNDFDSAPPRE